MNLKKPIKDWRKSVAIVLLAFVILFSAPAIYAFKLRSEPFVPQYSVEFPVSVDLVNKTIIEDPAIETYLNGNGSPLQANALFSSQSLKKILSLLVISISKVRNNNLALVAGDQFVSIPPGLRKEEIANIFGKQLGWTEEQKKIFLTPQGNSTLPMKEGSFYSGVYAIERGDTPEIIQEMINKRFQANIISRYSPETAEKVPLEIALNIASLIQRETLEKDDMRLVSGIIWNRYFNNMNLQLDATLQYAKANTIKNGTWWPNIYPNDKYIKSPYNTYMNKGLPPAPIANPSLAAVTAALNPVKTDCLFYFHDQKGDMHCTHTYKEHVDLLKKYYGRGK